MNLGKRWPFIVVCLIALGLVCALVARCAPGTPTTSPVPAPSASSVSPSPMVTVPGSVPPWEKATTYDSGENLPRLTPGSPLPRTNDWKVFAASLATGLYSRDWTSISYEDAQNLVTSSCLSKDHGLGAKARALCEQAAVAFTGERDVFAERQRAGTRTSVTVTGMQVEQLKNVLTPYGAWFDDVLTAGLGKGIGAFTVVGTLTETRDGVTSVSPFRLGVICWYQTPSGRWDDLDVSYGRGIPGDAWLELVGLFPGGF